MTDRHQIAALLSAAGVCSLMLITPGARAQQEPPAEESAAPAYSRKGADTCLGCHDSQAELAVFKTSHAQGEDPDSPFAQLQCESCHGPGGDHGRRLRRNEERPPVITFGRTAATPIAEQNAVCLGCHEKDVGFGWAAGAHGDDEVACADCHRLHAERDPVSVVSEQPEICYQCHRQQRVDGQKASVHPIRYGKMACSGCHDPHEPLNDFLLARQTLNETCYQCHAEKRGPFLWEHPPVAEDCSHCHRSHGSNHQALLTKRPPLLCQQCHSQAGHPSIAYTARGIAPAPSAFLLGNSCLNCHSQVHGSNHPSGPRLTR